MIYVGIFVLGTILGSYLNSWMWRVHEGKWRWGGRSVCVGCGRVLAWHENIPLVSFLWLRGRCRTCQIAIPQDYFLVELAVPLLLVGLTYFHLNFLTFEAERYFRDFIFVIILVVVFVYDYKYKLILSGLVWAGAIVGLVLNLFVLRPFTSYILLFNHNAIAIGKNLLLAAAVAGGFFLLQYLVSRGRWVGGGDVRLGFMMGVWLGWPVVLVALFVAYIVGAVVAVPLLALRKKGMNSEIPFGTFLAVGTMVALIFGSDIIRWYWGLIV